RQIEILQFAGTSVDDGLIGTAWRIGERLIQRREAASASRKKTQLITAAHCCLAGAKPRDLPCKTDCRSDVVPVFRPYTRIRFLCSWSNELQFSDIGANAGPHPVGEA